MKVRLLISGRGHPTSDAIPESIELPDGASVADALQALTDYLPDGTALPDTCLISVSGTHLGTLANHQPQTLCEGDELVIIAPVAGG